MTYERKLKGAVWNAHTGFWDWGAWGIQYNDALGWFALTGSTPQSWPWPEHYVDGETLRDVIGHLVQYGPEPQAQS